MNNNVIFNLLQFAGGTFPGGGFSQSWGLETYVTNGKVHNTDTLNEFLYSYIDSIIGKSEGPIVKHVMDAVANDDDALLHELEELSIASKLTKESRESSLRMGKAFMRISSTAIGESSDPLDNSDANEDSNASDNSDLDFDSDPKLINRYNKMFKSDGISYTTAYGIAMQCLGVPAKDAITAYVFNSVNTIVQSAVKLVPLGNTESQEVILKMQNIMNDAVDTAMTLKIDHIVTFCPGLDIAGMEHENLAVRLYMT